MAERPNPDEWHNRAAEPAYAGVLEELRPWLPQEEAAPAPQVAWPDEADRVAEAVWHAAGEASAPVPVVWRNPE